MSKVLVYLYNNIGGYMREYNDVENFLKEIGFRIAYYRKERSISQEKLAEMLEISIPQMSKLECGRALLNVKQIVSLCKIFNISPNELIFDNINFTEDKSKNINNLVAFAVNSLNINSKEDKELLKNILNYFDNKNS